MTTHPAKGYSYIELGVNPMPGCEKNQNVPVYQITIHGNLDSRWSGWFNDMTISTKNDSPFTTLTGPITDQAKLRGILNKLWDLNMIIISVHQLQDRI
jgi:hypothetical protein